MDNSMGTELGKNLTGAMMSPKDSKLTRDGAVEYTQPVPDGDISDFAQNRIRYMKESGAVGSVPMPGTIRGAISAIQEKVMNGNHIFMDKLGERIAFERAGTRLYEVLLSKYHGSEDKETLPPLEMLLQFHEEELRHFQMASEVMKGLGGDPTAVTPSADVCGVAALGWIQAMTDPRTTFKQSLEIILQAELVDNSCWEVLIELAESTGLNPIAKKFQDALEEEAIHLATVKQWVLNFNLYNSFEAGSINKH